jgi:hypothetical protein
MLPMIYELWVVTYFHSGEAETKLFTEQVYLEKLPAQKAMWYQNAKNAKNPNNKMPRLEVQTVEEYTKTREQEAWRRCEIAGEFGHRD